VRDGFDGPFEEVAVTKKDDDLGQGDKVAR